MEGRRLVGATDAETLRGEHDSARFLEREGDRHSRRLGVGFRKRQPSWTHSRDGNPVQNASGCEAACESRPSGVRGAAWLSASILAIRHHAMLRVSKGKPTDGARPTMADVARELGVAKITVSRALSNHSTVKDSTRTLVRETAERMGYRLNVSARNLRQQRTRTIAV